MDYTNINMSMINNTRIETYSSVALAFECANFKKERFDYVINNGGSYDATLARILRCTVGHKKMRYRFTFSAKITDKFKKKNPEPARSVF